MKVPRSFSFVLLVVSLLAGARAANAQSSDQGLPTPVLAKEINGRIPALDLGDARVTRHFYAFEGVPGDLLITIDGKNLNGDIDIFTAVTFRPLMKTSLYANSRAGEVTKGIYLRARQILILRVEARTPNDEEGSYHVRFGGSFAAFSGGIPVAENTEPQEDATRSNREGKRLSSVGATIAEPVVETPAATAEPTPAAATEKPAEEAARKTPAPKSTKPRPTRPSTTARNSRGRTPVKPKPAPKSDTEAAKTSEAKTEEAATEAAKKDPGVAGEEKTAVVTPEKSEATKPQTQELPPPGAHLIIESKDGTKIDRPMSTVRRVIVEGGMIVIVLKTGKIERIPMSTVARMAIEP